MTKYLQKFLCVYTKIIDYFHEYGIILLMVNPTAKWIAKSVSNSNRVTIQMVMWKHIAICYVEKCADGFQILQSGYEICPQFTNIDDKILSISPQTEIDNRVSSGLLLFVAFINIAN